MNLNIFEDIEEKKYEKIECSLILSANTRETGRVIFLTRMGVIFKYKNGDKDFRNSLKDFNDTVEDKFYLANKFWARADKKEEEKEKCFVLYRGIRADKYKITYTSNSADVISGKQDYIVYSVDILDR